MRIRTALGWAGLSLACGGLGVFLIAHGYRIYGWALIGAQWLIVAALALLLWAWLR